MLLNSSYLGRSKRRPSGCREADELDDLKHLGDWTEEREPSAQESHGEAQPRDPLGRYCRAQDGEGE